MQISYLYFLSYYKNWHFNFSFSFPLCSLDVCSFLDSRLYYLLLKSLFLVKQVLICTYICFLLFTIDSKVYSFHFTYFNILPVSKSRIYFLFCFNFPVLWYGWINCLASFSLVYNFFWFIERDLRTHYMKLIRNSFITWK